MSCALVRGPYIRCVMGHACVRACLFEVLVGASDVGIMIVARGLFGAPMSKWNRRYKAVLVQSAPKLYREEILVYICPC